MLSILSSGPRCQLSLGFRSPRLKFQLGADFARIIILLGLLGEHWWMLLFKNSCFSAKSFLTFQEIVNFYENCSLGKSFNICWWHQFNKEFCRKFRSFYAAQKSASQNCFGFVWFFFSFSKMWLVTASKRWQVKKK